MNIEWISTASGTFVCVVGPYHGIVCPMNRHWAARVEDGSIVDPGEVMFTTVDAAKAWVEHKIAALMAEHTTP